MPHVDLRLVQDDVLERSCVVANCRMNRERALTGSNGYAKEIGFNPCDSLMEKTDKARWLDLCCGSGKALIEAAQMAHDQEIEDKVEIVGVDLVGPQSPPDPRLACLHLVKASLAHWQPTGQFDLITCVHGLHYIGDKFGLVTRAASWLTDDGRFVANLDLNNIKIVGVRQSNRLLAAELRKSDLEYNARKKLLRCFRRMSVHLPFRYLGADDQAGPNYTKQPAVDSYYEKLVAGEDTTRIPTVT